LKVFGPVQQVFFLYTSAPGVGDRKAVARFATAHEASIMLHYLTNPSSPFMMDDRLIRVELYRGDMVSTGEDYRSRARGGGDRRGDFSRGRDNNRVRVISSSNHVIRVRSIIFEVLHWLKISLIQHHHHH